MIAYQVAPAADQADHPAADTGVEAVAARRLTREASLRAMIFRISSEGKTRFVLLIGSVALKFARGARGRRSNLYESGLYSRVSGRRRAMLCPIVWCAPLGILLVSRRARPLCEAEKDRLLATNGFPDWDWERDSPDNSHPFECKSSDWGVFDGRLVALDYATPVLFPDD
jgi:hypothetical protein